MTIAEVFSVAVMENPSRLASLCRIAGSWEGFSDLAHGFIDIKHRVTSTDVLGRKKTWSCGWRNRLDMVDLVDYEASFCLDVADVHREKTVQKCISTFLHVLSYPGLVSSSPTSENLVFALVSSSTFDHLRKCRLVCWQVAARHRRANVEKQRLHPETQSKH